jgi:O-antigen/teichoic acid export membrane protein
MSHSASVPEDPDAAWDGGRKETITERWDRNWAELLQELRVTQTGTQILTGFLLAAVFQSRFEDLDAFQRGVYLALVASSILTTLVGLAPVSLHRALFRRRAKDRIVRVTDALVRITLAGVAITVAGIGLLIFDLVLGRAWGIGFGAFIAIVVVVVWIVVPRRIRPSARGSVPG